MARRATFLPRLLPLLLGACATVQEPPPPAPAPPPPPPPPPPAAHAPRAPDTSPTGEVARLAGSRVAILAGGEVRYLDAADLHAPPSDPAIFGISPTAVLFLDDGTLLVGGGDGLLTALASAKKGRFSLGFRGAIRGLAASKSGAIALTTDRGVMALLDAEGHLRWEREVTAERLGPPIFGKDGLVLAASQRGIFALSASGDPAFTHAAPLGESITLSLQGEEISAGDHKIRLDAPHPPIPDLTPTFPLTFKQIETGRYSAVIELAGGEILALADYTVGEYNDWPNKPTQGLTRVAGGKKTWIPLPHRTTTKDVFVPAGLPSYATSHGTTKPDTAPLVWDALVRGPKGAPWILGRRLSPDLTSGEDGYTGAWIGAGTLATPDGKGIREVHDLDEAFSEHLGRGTQLGRVAAAPIGEASLLCFGFGDVTCASMESGKPDLTPSPGPVTAVERIGNDFWILTESGEIHRMRGGDIAEVPRMDGRGIKAVGGTSDRDVWAEPNPTHVVLHHDGTDWREVGIPWPSVDGFSARAHDDVWAHNASARWDGTRWSAVYGAPTGKRVLARTHDDVWVAGEGLWQGTAPGPATVRVKAPPADPGAVAPAIAATLGAAEAGFAAERWTFPLGRKGKLTAALRATAVPDGGMWIQAWSQLIEVDPAGKTKTIRGLMDKSLSRRAVPEAAGRGFVIDRTNVWRIDAAKQPGPLASLDRRTLLAVDRNRQGAVWAIGSAEPELRFPLALVRPAEGDPFFPVLGLPEASYDDVAVSADGGAWLCGGMSPGPSGEGILVQVRGKAGGEGTSRFRAPATLLAVSSPAPGEAWAVGAAGTIVHVRDGAITRYALPSGAWLRAVLAETPGEAWIAGDGGTLLHVTGDTLHPVNHPLGSGAAITGIAASGGAIWAVSPSGILRIARRP